MVLFKRLQADSHTVVLITHDPEVAARADRIFVIRDGELHEQARAVSEPVA
jgi:predicted ABC-type transport system involved in lysophospholipase L1 biosynthesis ATPase subunit